MAKGQKTCPGCSAVLGCRSHECGKCGHVFVAKRLRSTEIEETPKTETETPKRKTRKSQWSGDQIDVDLLRDRTKFLPLMIEDDGNIIALTKPVIITKVCEPNLAFNSLPSLIEADIHAKTISVWDGMVADGAPSRVISGALK